MEERLSAPLPLLPLDTDSRSISSISIKSVASTSRPLTTPKTPNDAQLVINWQAANLLRQIDSSVLINKVPKLAGSFSEIEQVPIIKSYMNLLLLLQEKDTDKQWITRFPYYQEDASFLIDQVEPLIRVNKKFSFRVPYVYAYGLAGDPKNELGLDFLLLDFIEGRQMPMWTETFPARSQKQQILDQVADVYLEMFSKPVVYKDRLVLQNANDIARMQDDFDSFEIPPTATATSYLVRLADQAIRGKFERLLADDALERCDALSLSLEERSADLFTLLLMRATIPDFVVSRYNDSPFFITHPDLHNRNIIIRGKPVTDVPTKLTHSFSTSEAPCMSEILPTTSTTAHSTPREDIKVAGLVDWDAAHPLPLQLAAIYPKFLETLPGAEFPDLPTDYTAPKLDNEKAMFLNSFKCKELAATGYSIVANLIEKGSWERDFFTVALRRGDVRVKWYQWWQSRRLNDQDQSKYWLESISVKDIERMRQGLIDFLRKENHRVAISNKRGWPFVYRVLLKLDEVEALNVEHCWTLGCEPQRFYIG